MKHFFDHQHKRLIPVYSPVAKRIFNDPRFVKRINGLVRVNHSYNIPYLAGYSKDGKTVYFDSDYWKHRFLNYYGKKFDTSKFILFHEVGEKAIEDIFHSKYQIAHHIITHFELKAVDLAGLPSARYSAFLRPMIKKADHESITRVPWNLDLKPYQDEKDLKILRKLLDKENK